LVALRTDKAYYPASDREKALASGNAHAAGRKMKNENKLSKQSGTSRAIGLSLHFIYTFASEYTFVARYYHYAHYIVCQLLIAPGIHVNTQLKINVIAT
jgi:hypothetical protein